MSLPIIDLENFNTEVDQRRIAYQLDQAFCDSGFCYVRNFGVHQEQRDAVFAASAAFHGLKDVDKQEIRVNEFHRGYIPISASTIRASTIEPAKKSNYNASFMMMHPVGPKDPRFGQPLQGPNQWPRQLPDFQEVVSLYHNAMTELGHRFTRLISLALGLAEGQLNRYFLNPTSWLRLLYYPLQAGNTGSQAALGFGSAPHTDHGFITFLSQDDTSGLEVRLPRGDWTSVPPIPGTLVVNVADMLSKWSGGRWPSTPHRVVNHPTKTRFSIAFFWDPAMETEVHSAHLGIEPSADDIGPVKYGEYVLEKLGHNYDYRKNAGA